MAENIDINLKGEAPAEATAPAATASLSDEVLQQPVIQALMAGSPSAVSADIPAAFKTPLGETLAKHGKELQDAGFGFYRSQDGKRGVVFNALYIHPEAIVQADQAGTLTQIAPPYQTVEQALAANPESNPVLGDVKTPEAAPAPPVPGGGAPAAVAPAGGRVARQLASDRRQNIQPESPTSGPRPGGGRVLNAIMKPVV